MLIRNATLLTPTQTIVGDCLIVDGKIASLGRVANNQPALDATGLLLAPGFIDLQCNGGFGHDFTHNPASIWQVAAQLPQFGVTSFLPTIITSPLATITQAQSVLAQPPSEYAGATPLGLHLEGPYLNPVKKGAHPERYLRAPNAAEVQNWHPQANVLLVTVAPERPNAQQLIQQLIKQGVVVSAGHSTATFAEAMASFNTGVRYGTHLFNAMPTVHHREPGLVGALLDDLRPVLGIIADGIHVHPSLLQLVWRIAPERVNLVTDAMAAMGCAPGQYQLGAQTVTVDHNSARLADGTLAGSIITLDQAIRNWCRWTHCSLADAIRTVTEVPAALLNLQHKGKLEIGRDADLVLLTPDGTVHTTFCNGKITYAKSHASLS